MRNTRARENALARTCAVRVAQPRDAIAGGFQGERALEVASEPVPRLAADISGTWPSALICSWKARCDTASFRVLFSSYHFGAKPPFP